MYPRLIREKHYRDVVENSQRKPQQQTDAATHIRFLESSLTEKKQNRPPKKVTSSLVFRHFGSSISFPQLWL